MPGFCPVLDGHVCSVCLDFFLWSTESLLHSVNEESARPSRCPSYCPDVETFSSDMNTLQKPCLLSKLFLRAAANCTLGWEPFICSTVNLPLKKTTSELAFA